MAVARRSRAGMNPYGASHNPMFPRRQGKRRGMESSSYRAPLNSGTPMVKAG